MVRIQQEDAINLLLALKAKESLVRRWTPEKLALKLKALKEVPTSEFEELNEKERETLETVLAAVNNKERFSVGDPSAPKVKKVKEEKAPKEKKVKTKKSSKPVDIFGMREGTGGAVINSVLSDRQAKKPRQILDESGLKTPISRIAGHMKKLLERGLVEKTPEGWLVKPGVLSRKKPTKPSSAEETPCEGVKVETPNGEDQVEESPEKVETPVNQD